MAGAQPSRSRSPSRRCPWKDPAKEVHVGCKVRLKGLNVQRNGQLAIVEAFVPSSGKWRVRIATSNQITTLKPEYLTMEAPAANPPREVHVPAPPVIFRAEEPQSQPQERSQELRPGCKVFLFGLKSAVDLNGKQAMVEALVAETGRWRVKLNDGSVKDLKPDNLLVETSSQPPPEAAPAQAAAVPPGADWAAAPAADVPEGGAGLEAWPGEACGPGGRFVVQEKLGEGTFSTVYRCRDMQVDGMDYAVKFTRASPQTRKALEREIKLMGYLCTQVGEQDPEGVKCIVALPFFEGFEHRGRLAVAFEPMKCNLRAALERYGGGRGLPLLPTVRNFGRQLFLALRVLRRAGLIHCDVKPENLLLSRDNESVKLSDFGSTLGMAERLRTDEMQPRHYRSPEVILGQDYDTQIDVWSSGATLFELATDKTLFAGETNNEVVLEMLKVCGAFPMDFATTGAFSSKHFSANGDFLNAKGDLALNSPNPRVIPLQRFDPPSRPIPFMLEEALQEPPRGVPLPRHQGLVAHLTDLLGRCLRPAPAGRDTPEALLAHRFFQKGA